MGNPKHLPKWLLALVFADGLAITAYKHHSCQETQQETMASGGMENMGVFLRSI
jgi:hypothetical protein